MTERGYRSPEGKSISQGHVYRILNGSETSFQTPEMLQEAKADSQKVIEQPEEQPQDEEWQPKPLINQTFADNFAILTVDEQQKIAEAKAFAELQREELLRELEEEAEEAEEEPKHRSRKYLQTVPSPSDYTHKEHINPAQNARIHAVFNRRSPVEFETDESGEEKLFYGIPRLKHKQPHTTTRQYQQKSYGANRLYTS